MKEKVFMELNKRQPQHAEGHICIDLTDPLTGKVKQRVEGKNHTFDKLIYGGGQSAYYSWINDVTGAHLVLTDSTFDVDTRLPYVLGNVIGYGMWNGYGVGNYRGAYNSANQKFQQTLSSSRWKYQYDFTTAQANGTIGTIGLTHQFRTEGRKWYGELGIKGNSSDSYGYLTCDGRYSYSCSMDGIVTKFDNYMGSYITIDISAIVGKAGYKSVAYASDTGKYGIFVQENKLYIFSDNSFASLEATYDVSKNKVASSAWRSMYIYGDYIFCVIGVGGSYANYKTNSAEVQYTISFSKIATTEQYNGYNYDGAYIGTCAIEKYLFCGINYRNGYGRAGIFDMSTLTQIAELSPGDGNSSYAYSAVRFPLFSDLILICGARPGNSLGYRSAIAAKKLDTPITKTTANGMTVTYELEVFW